MSKNHQAWIFGSGGHSKVIYSFIQKQFENISFVLPSDEINFFENFNDYKSHHFFIGIGDNQKREIVFSKLKKLGAILPMCVGPNVYVDETAKIGLGVFIGAGAMILVNSIIGDNVIINTGSSVDHDCVIENNAQITAGVRLAGATKIGEGAFLGMGVLTIPCVSIGNYVQVMAGSVIVKDVEQNFIVGGYPAKVIKKIGE